MRPQKRLENLKVPLGVVRNLFYLNLLIFLLLVFSALGLHYFLRPKAMPVLAPTVEGRDRPAAGILGNWEIDSGRARRLLIEGMPILKRSDNP